MSARLLAMWLTLIPVLAGADPRATGDGAGTPDEAAIRQLEEQERLGVLNRDLAALERVWAEDFMVNSPLNTVSPNRATVLDLVNRGMLRYSAFERRIEQVRVLGDLAIVMGGETVQSAAEPAPPPVRRRFTHVWRRHDGGWRLVARHANNVGTL